jgi:RNA polymerase sigma-70 factor (ECF subfamily)
MFANASSQPEKELCLQRDGMAAFEALYKKYWYQLYCVACRQTGVNYEAEELVQNLFEKIWRNRSTLQVKNWGAFLMVSLRNMIIDFHRQKATKEKFLLQYNQPAVASTPQEEQLDQEQLLVLIENHLHELPEKTQTIFKLSRYEHKSVREIAGHMQLTEKAVEYHITKSLKLLRRHLRDYLNIFSTML